MLAIVSDLTLGVEFPGSLPRRFHGVFGPVPHTESVNETMLGITPASPECTGYEPVSSITQAVTAI